MARLRARARYPNEPLVKCRLKVLAWARKESMQLSEDHFGGPQVFVELFLETTPLRDVLMATPTRAKGVDRR